MATLGALRPISDRGTVVPHAHDADELHSLVRLLVEKADRSPAQSGQPADAGQDRVLLDIEVGDVRCVVLRRRAAARRPQSLLSPREQEIARMVAEGHPTKVIADVLEISCWTVCTHLRRVFAKLNVTSRAAMVAQLLNMERY